VNAFLWAATVLIVMQVPLLAQVFLSSSRATLLAALQASGSIWTVTLVLLAQGFQRSAYTILGVVAAVLTFAGGMVFVRFMEHELDP
jgi:multisubunit Na+/H+ antiporter MnhF subunit